MNNKWTVLLFLLVILQFDTVFIANAQLCKGSLGDPVVSITFGSGSSTHGGALSSGITSYTYSSNDFPTDGSYTIENSTAGSGSTWWSTTDHTGNSGGYMMVVNASYQKTDYFYKETITGLCSETTYEFAAWVMNLLRSSDISEPNITFLIETTSGSVINSYTTGDIPRESSAIWKQYGFYFTTPANTSTVVIRMRNNSDGGAPANDIALDDITFRPCGPEMTAQFTDNSSSSYDICEGTTNAIKLTATVSDGYNNPQYQWQYYSNSAWEDVDSATSTDLILDVSNYGVGEYRFRLSAGESANFQYSECKTVTNEITLTIHAIPDVKANGATICEGEEVELKATGASSYNWDHGLGEGSTHDVSPSVTTIYIVTGTDEYGCVAKDSSEVVVNEAPNVSAVGDTICSGLGAVIKASGAETYTWDYSLGSGAEKTVSPSVTTVYTVTGTGKNLCTNTARATVIVYDIPVLSIIGDTICQGMTAKISASGAQSYVWSHNLGEGDEKFVSPLSTTEYTVTGTSVYGCQNTGKAIVELVSTPIADYGIDTGAVCMFSPIKFINKSVSSFPLSYQWSFGDSTYSTDKNPEHIYEEKKSYLTSLIISNRFDCTDTAEKEINVDLLDVPTARFSVSPAEASIFEPEIYASDLSLGAVTCSYDWGDGVITDGSENSHIYTAPGYYQIIQTVINDVGCDNSDTNEVYIYPEYRCFIPNAFTPNDDGINDLFMPVVFGIHDYTLQIFDRWGEKLFETNDENIGWNGTFDGEICPIGAYFYIIRLADDVEGAFHNFSGSVTLVK